MKTDRELDTLLNKAFQNPTSISNGLEEKIVAIAGKTPQKRIVLFAIKPMILQTSFCLMLAVSGFLFGLVDNNYTNTETNQTNYEINELLWGSSSFEGK